jgi:peptidoglycan/LPS O-acetylase OafA/YrhL
MIKHSLTKNVPTNIARVDFLDGIRGWASFAVLLSHILMCFLVITTPILNYDRARLMESISNHNYLDILVGISINFMTDGHLAVLIFFVLSGYALSIGHLDLANRKLALATASRYFRLMVPILITSLIAYVLLKYNLMFNLEVAKASDISFDWLAAFYRFDPNIKDVIKFSFYDVFFEYDGTKTYNAVLWTMPIELIGSFMIYAYLGIFRTTESVRWRLVLLSTFVLFIIKPLYSCFLIGYLIAEVNRKYSGGIVSSFLNTKQNEIFFVSIFFISAALSTYFRGNAYATCFFATCIVISVSFSRNLKSFFSNKLSKYLGRISFPLYLIQIPVICSFSSFLYLKFPTLGLGQVTANLINFFATVALALVVATLLLPVEKLSVTYSKKIGRLFIT